MIRKKNEIIDVYEQSKKELPEDIVHFIEKCMKEEHPDSMLIAVLHKIQDRFGFLAREKLEAVSQLMRIPAAKVSGVASFYHYFHLTPRGKYVISVCTGTACFVKGAGKIIQKLEEELGIKCGETTKDGLFTLEEARCLGACALAPVVKIGSEMHPQVTPDKIPALLEVYFQKEKANNNK